MIIGVVDDAVWSVYFEYTDDALMAALWERGTCGIEEQDGGWRAYFSGHGAEALALAAAAELEGIDPREELEFDEQLTASTSEPILIGSRFYVGPADQAPDGRVSLEITTGNGFGTGRHETTQLCLSALERLLRPGNRVLDVGCGSGILSLAARLLDAGLVVSCDLFEDVARAARENAQTFVFTGSADSLTDQSFDLVLANLTGAVLDRLAFDLKRVTKWKGRLLISGFLQDAPPRCYSPEQAFAEADWLCWICRPEQIEAPAGSEAEGGLTHATEWWL